MSHYSWKLGDTRSWAIGLGTGGMKASWICITHLEHGTNNGACQVEGCTSSSCKAFPMDFTAPTHIFIHCWTRILQAK